MILFLLKYSSQKFTIGALYCDNTMFKLRQALTHTLKSTLNDTVTNHF